MRAIFCIDPGGQTGIASAIVDDRQDTALDAVRDRAHSFSTTLKGSTPDQIRALYIHWVEFKRRAVQQLLLDPTWIDLVIEDFALWPGERPGKDTTAPERVAWGFEGYRMACRDNYRKAWPKHYTEICWQQSGAAYRFKNRDMLTRANAWIPGRDHERSAFAHMILRTNIIMDGRRRQPGRQPIRA